ncbi:mechanosensitive ion channel family protein [Alloiococcus sp. CFN-8]|uniref:mechanosensitive ion channel family protein n=1 Tax=Alloiococcus sp. CFN-8 TaxID=3416081 RepID=UPI003CEEA59C
MLANMLASSTGKRYLEIFGLEVINSDMLISWGKTVLKIIIIGIIMIFVIKIGNKLIDKVVKKQVESRGRFSLDSKKAYTFGSILKSILRYATYFFGITAILSMIFGPISITIASIGGVAIGLGSQSLVKDIINGLFILFENQFSVGDYIIVGSYRGIVEDIGLRTTLLKDFNGDIHIIPNSAIAEVTNKSVADSRMQVDVQIAYEEDAERAMKIIDSVCEEFSKNKEEIVEPPKVVGLTSLNEFCATIRVLGKSRPMMNWALENELRMLIKNELKVKGVEVPYTKTRIIGEESVK